MFSGGFPFGFSGGEDDDDGIISINFSTRWSWQH